MADEILGKKHGGARPGSGMKPGTKTQKMIEREAARKAYQQLVLERLKPIFEHQYSLVKGTAYLYRMVEHNGSREQVMVTDADEIGDVLSQMDTWEGQVINDQYYYITVRAPESRAIDSMLDRAIGKAAQPVVGEDGGPLQVTVVKFADGDSTTP